MAASFHEEGRLIDDAVEEAIAAVTDLIPGVAISDGAFYSPSFPTLHYLIVQVIERTGFPSGLFSEHEQSITTMTISEHAEFMDKIILCVGISIGEKIEADLIRMMDGLRHAPMIAANFFVKLCRVALDETLDRSDAVARTLRKEKPNVNNLPRLKVRALLVVEVLQGHDLKLPTWGFGKLSPFVDLWVTSTPKGGRKRTEVLKNVGSNPVFSDLPGGAPKFQFVVEKPHKEFLFLGAYGFKGLITSGSGTLIGQADMPLARISSIPSDFEAELVADSGDVAGSLSLRVVLHPIKSKTNSDGSVPSIKPSLPPPPEFSKKIPKTLNQQQQARSFSVASAQTGGSFAAMNFASGTLSSNATSPSNKTPTGAARFNMFSRRKSSASEDDNRRKSGGEVAPKTRTRGFTLSGLTRGSSVKGNKEDEWKNIQKKESQSFLDDDDETDPYAGMGGSETDRDGVDDGLPTLEKEGSAQLAEYLEEEDNSSDVRLSSTLNAPNPMNGGRPKFGKEKSAFLSETYDDDDDNSSDVRLSSTLNAPNPMNGGARSRAMTTGHQGMGRIQQEEEDIVAPIKATTLSPSATRREEQTLVDMGFSRQIAANAMLQFNDADDALGWCVDEQQKLDNSKVAASEDALATKKSRSKSIAILDNGEVEEVNQVSDDLGDLGLWETDPMTAKASFSSKPSIESRTSMVESTMVAKVSQKLMKDANDGQLKLLADSYFASLVSASFPDEGTSLGFNVEPRDHDSSLAVTSVCGAALKAGIRKGDIVVGLNGRQFAYGTVKHHDLVRILSTLPRPMTIHFWRFKYLDLVDDEDDGIIDLSAPSSSSSSSEKQYGKDIHISFAQGALGFEVEDQSMDLSVLSTKTPPSVLLVVSGLKEGGQAGSLGIRNGDVLIGINGSPLVDGTSLNGFGAKIKKLSAPPTVVVWRSSQRISELQKEAANKRKVEAERVQRQAQAATTSDQSSNIRRSSCLDMNTNNASLSALTNMGFSTARAEAALRKAHGNIEVALESLLTDTDNFDEGSAASTCSTTPAEKDTGISFVVELNGPVGIHFNQPPKRQTGARERRLSCTSELVIASVDGGSSAEAARCKPGDSVVAVANIHVTSVLEFKNALQEVRSSRNTVTITAVPKGGDLALVLSTLTLAHPDSLDEGGRSHNEDEGGNWFEQETSHSSQRVGSMQHIASGSMTDLADEKGRVKGVSNFGAQEYSIVFTEARAGLSLQRTDDGRLSVAKARFASAARGVQVGDVLCGMNNSPISFGMEQTLMQTMIEAAERPLVLNFWRAGTSTEQEVGVYFGPNVSSLGLDLELSEDGKWTIEEVEGISAVRGLNLKDVVVGVNHWPLPDHCDLFKVLSSAGRPLILNILVSSRRRVAIRGDHLIGDIISEEEARMREAENAEDEEEFPKPKAVQRKTCLL